MIVVDLAHSQTNPNLPFYLQCFIVILFDSDATQSPVELGSTVPSAQETDSRHEIPLRKVLASGAHPDRAAFLLQRNTPYSFQPVQDNIIRQETGLLESENSTQGIRVLYMVNRTRRNFPIAHLWVR